MFRIGKVFRDGLSLCLMIKLVKLWLFGRWRGFDGVVVIFLIECFWGGLEFLMVLVVGLCWRSWFLRIGSSLIKVVIISKEGKI